MYYTCVCICIYTYIIHIYIYYIYINVFGGVYICVLQFSLFIYCKHEAFNGFFIEFENPEKQTQRVRWGAGGGGCWT